ncbi:MAG: peptidylprolyl isomerase [Candidatus Sumerlaeaceae bacterium]
MSEASAETVLAEQATAMASSAVGIAKSCFTWNSIESIRLAEVHAEMIDWKCAMGVWFWFCSALCAQATAPVRQIPAGGKTDVPRRDAATTSVAVREGLPMVDPQRMGRLNLEKLPTGPDGKKMVAMVNGVPISEERFLSVLRKAVEPAARSDLQRVQGEMAAFASPVLEQMIAVALYRQYAARFKLAPAEHEINGEMARMNARLPAGRKLQDEAFASGRTAADVRQDVEDQLISSRVEERVNDQFTTGTPTNEQLKSLLLGSNLTTSRAVELRASHIVFRAKPDMTKEQIEDARARADRVLGLVRGGLDFATAARQHSQDRHTAAIGGDLGYFTAGRMLAEFDKAAFELRPGEVSGVVRTPVGFHIIKVSERHEDTAHSMYFLHEKAAALTRFRENLKQSAKIERFI